MTILVFCAAVLCVFLLVRLLASGKGKAIDTGTSVAQTDAEHFATLLVSEIDTYNKDKVREARRNHNILATMHEEIHQAELMYQQRYGFPRSGERDYFREALIKILAGGDRRALGRPDS